MAGRKNIKDLKLKPPALNLLNTVEENKVAGPP